MAPRRARPTWDFGRKVRRLLDYRKAAGASPSTPTELARSVPIDPGAAMDWIQRGASPRSKVGRAADGHPLLPMIALAGYAGMRRGEATAATWGDVDLDAGRLKVRGTKGYADRAVPIPGPLDAILRAVPEGARRGRIVVGGPEHVESSYRQLRVLCDAAGVARVTWHELRHTYATALLSSGTPLPEIQRLLGHTSLASTGIYTHASIEAATVSVRRTFG